MFCQIYIRSIRCCFR